VFFTTCSPSDEEQLVLPGGREALGRLPLMPRSPVRNAPCLNVSSFVCLSAIAGLTLAKWNLMKERQDSHHHPLIFCFLGPLNSFPNILAFHLKINLEQVFSWISQNKCIRNSLRFYKHSFSKWLTLWYKNKVLCFYNNFSSRIVELLCILVILKERYIQKLWGTVIVYY
jgi:hypothetical protein